MRQMKGGGGACLQRLVFVLKPRAVYLEEIVYNFGFHCEGGRSNVIGWDKAT